MAGRSGVLPSTTSRNKTQTSLPPLAATRCAQCTTVEVAVHAASQATVYRATAGGDITPLLTYVDGNVRAACRTRCYVTPVLHRLRRNTMYASGRGMPLQAILYCSSPASSQWSGSSMAPRNTLSTYDVCMIPSSHMPAPDTGRTWRRNQRHHRALPSPPPPNHCQPGMLDAHVGTHHRIHPATGHVVAAVEPEDRGLCARV